MDTANAGKLPIKDFKDVLVLAIMAAMYADNELGDGLDFPEDIISAIKLYRPALDAWEGKENIIPQYLDMDEQEREEIDAVIASLDLRDDAKERTIEGVAGHAISITQHIQGIVSLIKDSQKEPGKVKGSPVLAVRQLKAAKVA